MSGSKVPAAQGQLIFLCGGDEPLFNEVVGSDLAAMGKASFFFGRVGSGTRMKLVVNMVMGSMMAAFGEGLALAKACGADGAKLLQVLDLGAMANPMFKLKGPKMLAADHAPHFPLEHAEKDVRLAGELGAQLGLALPVAATADAAMKKSIAAGHGRLDFSATFLAQAKA